MVGARGGTEQLGRGVYAGTSAGRRVRLIATAATGGGQGLPPTLPAPAPTPTPVARRPIRLSQSAGAHASMVAGFPAVHPRPHRLLRQLPAPAPAPAPTTGCTTPDPFVSIGGGTCVSGGWRPGVRLADTRHLRQHRHRASPHRHRLDVRRQIRLSPSVAGPAWAAGGFLASLRPPRPPRRLRLPSPTSYWLRDLRSFCEPGRRDVHQRRLAATLTIRLTCATCASRTLSGLLTSRRDS